MMTLSTNITVITITDLQCAILDVLIKNKTESISVNNTERLEHLVHLFVKTNNRINNRIILVAVTLSCTRPGGFLHSRGGAAHT